MGDGRHVASSSSSTRRRWVSFPHALPHCPKRHWLREACDPHFAWLHFCERVFAGPKCVQTTKPHASHPHTGEERMDAGEPPSGSQCDEIGDRKWFRRQLQDLKRWFIRAKVHEPTVKLHDGLGLLAKVGQCTVIAGQSSTAPWQISWVEGREQHCHSQVSFGFWNPKKKH